MIRSIMVPLDGLAFGEHALPMALSLARKARGSIRLLHVVQPFLEVVPELAAYQGPVEAEYRQERQKYLNGVVQRLRKESDVPVTAELREGEIPPAIRQAAMDGADLVVMTTHGRGPFTRFWLGSVADQLVREMPVPLLLMHPGKEKADFRKEPSFKHILLPLDGTPLAEQMIAPATDLAKLMDAEVTLFHVLRANVPLDYDYRYSGAFIPTQIQAAVAELQSLQERQKQDTETYLRSMADKIRSKGVAASVKVVSAHTPAEAILQESEAVDSVALATHGYGGLERLLLGSVADKIIRGSTVPVLVLRPKM